MGFIDSIKAQLASGLQDELASVLGKSWDDGKADASRNAVAHVVDVINQQGLGPLLQKLQENGLSDKVKSWLGSGHNLPISADQVRRALGSDTVQKLAAKVGIPPEQAASLLAHVLPHAVDAMTPGGSVEGTDAGTAAEADTAEAPTLK